MNDKGLSPPMQEESKHNIVEYEGPDDHENPQNFSVVRKWFITIIIVNGSFCVAATSSIYTSTYKQMVLEFGTNREVATLGLSLFVLGLGTSPLFLAPLSEFYGRRPIYLVSFFFFFIWQIPCAFAKNIETMLIVRYLAGFSGAAFLSVAGGSVSDLFSGPKLTLPMAIFSCSPFLGPVFGPLIGDFINQYTTWRWTFRLTMIWTFLLWLCLFVLVPETYSPAVLANKAKRLRQTSGDLNYRAPIEVMDKSILRTILTNLRRPFILFVEPIVLLLNTWTSILLAILYLFFSAFPIVFEQEHNFQQSQVGMTFLGLGIGMGIAVCLVPIFSRVQRRIAAEKGDAPELALLPAMAGAILGPIGLFWFAFTTKSFWLVPILAGIPFGCATVLTFISVFTFLIRSYTPWAASAMASNSVERSLLAAVFREGLL
ncbi:protein of unknown function [Taphrina deformans PYCC 5710]|uniref:Major facilitator superfamily (MFS) profile domain-containing protein n=1 Tax=Taphrina deformans (strain PYCC 5710 / ATCC 11124 / CBS 356.35 / IMI 108563 / JCM 9778 / NBRC 8474) TaxID=1097556 RepID=R4XFM1_TAPDE|nr:protein of unknown function [Taphrina deformans PYCC 5710]|eukprot:CCG84646.1 protein of unknown function [Taphrina deformans PYCC 5710]